MFIINAFWEFVGLVMETYKAKSPMVIEPSKTNPMKSPDCGCHRCKPPL